MSPRQPNGPTLPETETLERTLPSGRSLVLRAGAGGEEIEIRGAGGDVDLRITLTDAGPVVSLRGARVDVDTADVAFRCRTFDVQATGDVRVASEQDIHLNGAFIRLNCTADGEAETQALLAQMAAAAEQQQGAHTGEPCSCVPEAPAKPDPAT